MVSKGAGHDPGDRRCIALFKPVLLLSQQKFLLTLILSLLFPFPLIGPELLLSFAGLLFLLGQIRSILSSLGVLFAIMPLIIFSIHIR